MNRLPDDEVLVRGLLSLLPFVSCGCQSSSTRYPGDMQHSVLCPMFMGLRLLAFSKRTPHEPFARETLHYHLNKREVP